MKATLITQMDGWKGEAYHFRIEDNDEEYYIIVSAVDAMFSGPETYIFIADENGKAVDMVEIDGSFRGAKNIKEALIGHGVTEIEDFGIKMIEEELKAWNPPTMDENIETIRKLMEETIIVN